jgi:hypothetical protein
MKTFIKRRLCLKQLATLMLPLTLLPLSISCSSLSPPRPSDPPPPDVGPMPNPGKAGLIDCLFEAAGRALSQCW